MPTWSSKHGKREQTFPIRSFPDGLNQEVSPPFLPVTALSRCRNMKYAYNNSIDGSKVVTLKKRQGTEAISSSAIGAAVTACTYYVADAHYIVATADHAYELNSSTFAPVEISDIALSGIPTFTEFHGKLIIHDSGVTKAWNGTTFETLNCLYEDELIGTGDGSTVDYSGTLDHPAPKSASVTITYTDGTAKTITSNSAGTLLGDVATHELMPNQVDRDFSGASAWANVDLNAYNETADLTITASAANQYCTLVAASAPTTIGKRYRMTFSVANIAATWTIKSFDGTQTIGTVSANGAQTFDWTATTTGGYRIVAVANNSSGDFDDFTLTTNCIDYTTGIYSFRASGAPDNTTPIYAEYEKVGGAPKSKAGFVRAQRLYLWGDSDYPSRLWYSGVNDEDAWDSSSDGGYIDIDPLDGYSLTSCLNFFQSIITIKGNSIGRIDNFPGDNTFRVEPLMKDTGSIAYRSCTNEGNVISFLSSKRGWVALQPAAEYGGVSQEVDLSKGFRTNAVRFATASAYSEFNKIDNQLWLTLYDSTTQQSIIYVINLETGGQLGVYKFEFGHTCYTFVNNEMLIGGSDGYLYRLLGDNSKFTDNGTAYSDETYVRGPMTHFGAPLNRKHNKKIYLHLYGKYGMTATFNVYTDGDYDNPIYTKSVSLTGGSQYINPDGDDIYIYDMSMPIGYSPIAERDDKINSKFDYRELMFELTDIAGAQGAEFYGCDFSGAILGD